MARYKVVLTDARWEDLDLEKAELGPEVDVVRATVATEDELIDVARDADGLLVTYFPISARVMDHLPKCKVVAVYGIGTDMVDLEAATQRGIFVTNVPDYCVEEVADHTMLLLLASARRLFDFTDSVARGEWLTYRAAKGPVYRLRGKVLGLLGFGKIAQAVARRAKAFGMNVTSYDPYVSAEIMNAQGVRKSTLEDLLRESDFVSSHLPLTEETRGMIDREKLSLLKRSAIIINCSRGAVFDEKALAEAVTREAVGGLAVDVLEQEPPPAGHPFIGDKRILVTPHCGFYSTDAIQELRVGAAKEVARVLRGEKPNSVVNRALLQRQDSV